MPSSKESGYLYLIGDRQELTTPAAKIPAASIYCPLQFWYCRSAGLALPLIAVSLHSPYLSMAKLTFAYLHSFNFMKPGSNY
jgi:hypothetical protein